MRKKIGVLVGGSSAEREVSFLSAENILNAADKDKFDIKSYVVPANKGTGWIIELINDKPDFVLNLLHGGDGENGAVQGLLDCIGIRYYGSDVLSSALCMSKNVSKTIMRAYDVPVAEDIFIKREQETVEFKSKIKELGFPLIVKPDNGGSSIGISVAENYDEVVNAAEKVRKLGDDILVERYIAGREICCCVIKSKGKLSVLPILDIEPESRIFDYTEKYGATNAKVNFSALPQFMQTMITEIAKKTFDILHCDDFAAVDMIVKEEQVYVIEVNTIPGLTKQSLITRAVEASGTAFGRFINMVLTEMTS